MKNERGDNVPTSRLILLSILGFFTPICLALIISPYFFEREPNFKAYARARLAADTERKLTSERKKKVDAPAELERSSFQKIASSDTIDPSNDSIFLVSARVRFLKLPEVGQRERLFYKYSVEERPYAGWALALRRWPGSMRPEVYWRDSQGKGGWFAFGDVEINEGVWYTFTFVVEGSRALSLYVNEASKNATFAQFVGGISVDEVSLPASKDPLFLAPVIDTAARGVHPVEASEFLVAELSEKGLKRLQREAQRNATSISTIVKQSELRLLVNPKGVSTALAS